jgi:hypothetical protein
MYLRLLLNIPSARIIRLFLKGLFKNQSAAEKKFFGRMGNFSSFFVFKGLIQDFVLIAGVVGGDHFNTIGQFGSRERFARTNPGEGKGFLEDLAV